VGGPLPRGASIPLILSKDAARQDLHLVLEPAQKYKNKELSDYARHWIYQDQTWGDFLHWPLVTGLSSFRLAVYLCCSQRLAAAARAQVWAPDQRPRVRHGGAVQP